MRLSWQERERANAERRAEEHLAWQRTADARFAEHSNGRVIQKLVDTDSLKISYVAGMAGISVTLFTADNITITRRMLRFSEPEIGRAILRLQDTRQRWPDGTLRGLKKLIYKDGKWISPSQKTVWDGDTCVAKEFKIGDEALRGHEGIHAVWADHTAELNDYEGDLIEVSGYGECVVGDIGWRAQFSKVVSRII